MLQTEYSLETELAVRGAEEREAGILLGMQRGMKRGMQQGIQKGIERGMQEGIERGMQQGIQKGLYNAKIETAKKLIPMGLSYESIAQATGLSMEEVLKL